MAFQVDKGKIAKNTIALYLRLGFTMVISFFTARVTLEQLGVEDYGLNNLVGSVVSMLTFLNGSMGTAVQRYFSIEIGKDNESNLKKVFGVGLSLHIIVAIFTFIVAEIFAVFFLSKVNPNVCDMTSYRRNVCCITVIKYSVFRFIAASSRSGRQAATSGRYAA